MTVHLSTEQLLYFGSLAYDAPVIVRDRGLIESALLRPQASAFGEDAYPDVWTKAAALLQSSRRTMRSSTGTSGPRWPRRTRSCGSTVSA